MARPTKPPMSAPAMPNRMVTMKPPGSRPGINSFAMTPTTRPKRIHERMPIGRPPLSFCATSIATPVPTPRQSRQLSRIALPEQDDAVRVGAFRVVRDPPAVRGLREGLAVDENEDGFETRFDARGYHDFFQPERAAPDLPHLERNAASRAEHALHLQQRACHE